MRTYKLSGLTALLLALAAVSWSADYAKGKQAYDSADYETAYAEWQALADEGDADSQFGMGLLYANGFGVALNDDEALKWYRLAADQGHAEAQCNLGVMHANGWGVPMDDAEAFKWYRLAAEQGVTPAQISIAKMYESGFGVELDKVQAHMWFNIASELGDMNATDKRDSLARSMSGEQIAEADRLSITWMESHHSVLAKD